MQIMSTNYSYFCAAQGLDPGLGVVDKATVHCRWLSGLHISLLLAVHDHNTRIAVQVQAIFTYHHHL